MVSNGRDVVLTGSDGGWRLPVAEGESVFVIKPAHWATRTGKGGVPRFSHRCGGTAGQACLSDPLDFALTRREEPPRFDVLMFADTQPANDIELGYLRDDIVASTLGSTAAFGINHGDVVFDNHALYPRYLEIMGATGIPWHHCPGNHDIDPGARDDAASRDTWQRVFGARHYAFQYAGTTFIVLDNVFYFGHSGSYCGRIGERQLQFVRNVLAHVPREQLVVVSMHIPLETYQDPANPGDNTADRDALLRLLRARPHAVSFAGHMHLTEHHYLAWKGADGIYAPHHHHVLTAASGAWWGGPLDSRGIPSADSADGNPNGYHILSVDGSDCLSRFTPSAARCVSLWMGRRCAEGRRTTPARAMPAPSPSPPAICRAVTWS
ncbi:MAG TPA: calcineurin-like phosphoesterase C-terminal domain-containing protein [Hyphomicrobiaceae bacterium]|nr:calcineurin-like phosphoesterase C-terminal domain-containing protein [Hyphomicrobiaceae bacterium]